MTPAAPLWVIDAVPFNGYVSPAIVLASVFPWRGLYRPANDLRTLTAAQEHFIEQMAVMLEALELNTQSSGPGV